MGGPHEKKMNGKKMALSHRKIKLHYKLFNNYINYH